MRTCIFVLFVLSVFLFPMTTTSHPGLKDRDGCHTKEDGTDYHCHENTSDNGVPWTERPLNEASGEEKSDPPDDTTKEDRIDELEYDRNTIAYRTTNSFDDDRALVTLGGSLIAVGLGGLAGSFIAPDHAGPILATTMGSGLMSSSIFSLQMGLGSKTAIAGGLLVGINITAPLILAGGLK